MGRLLRGALVGPRKTTQTRSSNRRRIGRTRAPREADEEMGRQVTNVIPTALIWATGQKVKEAVYEDQKHRRGSGFGEAGKVIGSQGADVKGHPRGESGDGQIHETRRGYDSSEDEDVGSHPHGG